MKVRMLTTVAGFDDDGNRKTLEAGQEYDLPKKEAQELCSKPEDAPRAEPIAQKPVQRAEKR